MGSFIDTAHRDAAFLTSVVKEADLQQMLAQHLRARDLDVTEGAERLGGETDPIIFRRLLIENKIAGETADPFAAKPTAPNQGNRYATAIASPLHRVDRLYSQAGQPDCRDDRFLARGAH
ncbi:hypothetical protein [Caulobacter hibisci]|uniref:Uncharacterized protein n=1 Tax=Caulobacter hibisci TaxID=2035993 RepID=A0ABS0SX01_9CAUL|nr:hypothetical protein [Caulobacter hibisci]MBI1684175.1 hypothetical protein [Caulobacter hibisci]